MKSTKPTGTASLDPFAKLDAILERTREPTGPEWFTAEAYAAHLKVSNFRVYQIMRNLVSDGKVEMWSGSSIGPSGQKRKMNKYRLING